MLPFMEGMITIMSEEHVCRIYGSHNIIYQEAKNDSQRTEITYHEGF